MENKESLEDVLAQEASKSEDESKGKLAPDDQKWLIPAVACGLVLMVFFMVALSSWDAVYVRSVSNGALWLMFVGSVVIPFTKVKEDKAYLRISLMPIELVGMGTWIVLQFVSESVWRGVSVQFFGSLFVGLCLLGYLVTYVKEIYEDKAFKDHFLWYQVYNKYLKVDLKRNQSLTIFIFLFVHPLLLLILVIFAIDVWRIHDPAFFLMVLFTSYLFVLFFCIRYKVSAFQKDYVKLHQMIRTVAEGNFAEGVDEDLGIFSELRDELANIQDGLAKSVEQAIASERMKGELITNVSHDLKTPLTSIITYVDLLQVDDLDDEKKRQYLNTLTVKTERLKTLVEDLFEVSKATTGNIAMNLMEVDVITLMKQTLLGLEDRIAASDLILREGYPEEPVKLMLDGGRMHRVFENLIINMIKYAMPGTRAYIDIIDHEAHVYMVLRNISAHELNVNMNDLAERFVRGDSARNTEGAGLGLAIAKSFVELQKGTFEIAVDGDLFKVIMTFSKCTKQES